MRRKRVAATALLDGSHVRAAHQIDCKGRRPAGPVPHCRPESELAAARPQNGLLAAQSLIGRCSAGTAQATLRIRSARHACGALPMKPTAGSASCVWAAIGLTLQELA